MHVAIVVVVNSLTRTLQGLP